MSNDNGAVATPEAPFSFEVTDVTGTNSFVASDVARKIPAGAVASALADRMSLPTNVPWTLRDETSSAFLDDTLPIGDQIADQARVTITPKAHLGGKPRGPLG